MKHSSEPSINTSAEEPSSIAWHPAFVEAIQLELEVYGDALQFLPEYQLTSEPLRIDCLVIKKAPGLVIEKNIAAIFRETNLLEYKSPGDYIAIGDFYKVYGYACLYTSSQKVPITGMTISFVESRYPRELIAHLSKIRGYKVEERSSGIYTVKGDIMPLQIIDSRRLSGEENLWLRALDNKLTGPEVNQIMAEVNRKGKGAKVQAYIDAIIRANFHIIREAMNMSSAAPSLEEIFDIVGLKAKAEARGVAIGEARGEAIGEARGEVIGEARGAESKVLEIAKNMVSLGLPLETVVSATKLDPEKVKTLYDR